MDTTGTVYLEDVQTTSKKDEAVASADTTPDNSQKVATAATGSKRQRTLEDMFAGKGKSSEPAGKKMRVSGSAPSGSTAKSSSSLGSGTHRLNSIAFSLSSFQESLSDEQKNLLCLECEVMGKSWYVSIQHFKFDSDRLRNCAPKG
jgi:uracil-DNA glycosylase